MKKIFWIAGEKSGDLHASFVLKELNKQPDIYNYGVGGDLMSKLNFHPLFDFAKFNVMGFVEVIKHISFFISVEKKIKKILVNDKPDLVVLVDYPGLNLRIAKIATKLNIKVLYYISPQFWAWKKKRIHKIKRYTDFVCCINPFEAPLLDKINIPNEYVGHPVAEQISAKYTKDEFAELHMLDSTKEWIGLFPGSREMELKKHLPVFSELVRSNPDRDYLLSVSDERYINMFSHIMNYKNVTLITGDNYDIMQHSDFLVVKSGTTTLESSLFATPFVIVYKANPITVWLARKVLKIKYIGLPNIITNRFVVTELIQEDMTSEKILKEINRNLLDSTTNKRFQDELNKIKAILGDKKASLNTSKNIMKLLNNE